MPDPWGALTVLEIIVGFYAGIMLVLTILGEWPSDGQ